MRAWLTLPLAAFSIRNALSNQVANENWVARMHWVYDSVPLSPRQRTLPATLFCCCRALNTTHRLKQPPSRPTTETDEHEGQVELKLSESGKYLYSSLQAFADNAALVLHPSVHDISHAHLGPRSFVSVV